MNDADGNPLYPRNPVAPPGWTGIACMRMVPKPAVWHMSYGRDKYARLVIRGEVCRGEIVTRDGRVACSFCGAVPTWA